MTLVLDASTLGTALTEVGAAGAWAEALLAEGELAAPHLLPAEVGSVLRRRVLAGNFAAASAAAAHERLVSLDITLVPYAPFAARVWELRETVTTYDAWYVALAEALDAPLATLDGRLSRASGPRCRFEVFPGRT